MEKSWKFSRPFCQDQDQDLLFVLEAPPDQDFGLEDCITGGNCPACPSLNTALDVINTDCSISASEYI